MDMSKENSTDKQPSKSTQKPIAELLKKFGINSVDTTKESLGKTSIMFFPLEDKEQEDSVGATMRNLNRAKK